MHLKKQRRRVKFTALALSALGLQTALLSGKFASVTAAAADDPGCRGCLQSASGLFARGDNAGAAKLLSQWQAKCPDNLQLALMLNTVLMRIPDGKKRALEAAENACRIAPNSMLAHFQKAMTMMQLGDGPGASKEFGRVVELDPTSYESWLALSELLAAQGDAAGAKNAESHAVQLSPSARQSLLNSITSKDRAGNTAGLKAEVARIVENSATTPETLLIIGEETMRLGYFEEAAACFNGAKSKYPDAPQIKVLLPYSVYESGKFTDKSAGKSAGKGTAGSAALEAIAGMSDLSAGNYEAGRKALENLTAAGDNPGIINLALGNLALRQGHYKAAIEKFSDAAKGKNLSAWKVYVALVNLEAGDFKEAIAEARDSYQKASGLKARATAIELMARLRDNEDNGGHIAALKGELTSVTKLSACDQALSECALGEEALHSNDLAHAKELFSSALGHQPGIVQGRVGLGRAALAAGDNKAGAAELDKALAMAPGNSQALAYKALAMINGGNAEAADKLINQAKEESELPAALGVALGKAYKKAGLEKQASQFPSGGGK